MPKTIDRSREADSTVTVSKLSAIVYAPRTEELVEAGETSEEERARQISRFIEVYMGSGSGSGSGSGNSGIRERPELTESVREIATPISRPSTTTIREGG